MTRAELAQLQNRREWEAERASLMERALAYAQSKRAEEAAKIQSIRILDAENFNRTPITFDRDDDRFHYEQQKTSRRARLYEHDRQSKSLAEWSTIYGLQESTVRQRLQRGWTLAQALTINPRDYQIGAKVLLPKGPTPKTYGHTGHRRTLRELSEASGVGEAVIRKRLAKGLTKDRALAPVKGKGPAPRTYEYNGVAKTIRQWIVDFDLPETSLRRCLSNGLSMQQAIDHCRLHRRPGRARRRFEGPGEADQLSMRSALTGGSPSTHAQL